MDKLEEKLKALSDGEQHLFHGLFHYQVQSASKMTIPPDFMEKCARWFDSGKGDGVARALNQVIVDIMNTYTFENVVFNPLRAGIPRPKGDSHAVDQLIEKSSQQCDFCSPERYTAFEQWGRAKGKHGCMSMSNISKAAPSHGLILLPHHDPRKFSVADVQDAFQVSMDWFANEHKSRNNTETKYPFTEWSCLPRAGASQVHGHFHVFLRENGYFGQGEQLLAAAARYNQVTSNNYFRDLIRCHDMLGLARRFKQETVLLAHLTPLKEKEILIFGKGVEDFSECVGKVLRCMIDKLGTECFNIGVYYPALPGLSASGKTNSVESHEPGKRSRRPVHDLEPNWSKSLPLLARIVDRGSQEVMTNDVTGLVLFGSAVSTFDPFALFPRLIAEGFDDSDLSAVGEFDVMCREAPGADIQAPNARVKRSKRGLGHPMEPHPEPNQHPLK